MHPESLPTEIEGQDRSAGLSKAESSTAAPRTLAGRLWYWWSLFAAAMLLLIFGPPVITAALIFRRPYWVYPWALFGARNWLRLSGVRRRVRGLENLDPRQSYVFIANHRSFLDTAMLFYHLRRRIGILAKKELLKVPIMGYGMGFVNILAIDRTNRESALRTTKAATDRLRDGVSFGVFAEGTRARPGELLPFKRGGFYMAVAAGVPVVPVAVSREQVSPELVERERQIFAEQARASGKPDNIIEKMIGGRIDKYYGEVALVEQPWVRDPSKTIRELVTEVGKQLGADLRVRRFARFQMGEE